MQQQAMKSLSHPRYGAVKMPSHVSMSPSAGVLVAVDHDVGAEGSETGQGHLVHGDDGDSANPLDRKRHGKDDVLVSVLDAGGEDPEIAVP